MPLRWDHEKDYEYLTEGIYLHDWAWEFLRRNPDYVRDHSLWHYLTADQDTADEELDKALWQASLSYGLVSPLNPSRSFLDVGPSWLVSTTVMVALSAPRLEEEHKPWPGYPEVIHLQFMLRVPVEAQLDSARQLLKRVTYLVQKREGVQAQKSRRKPQTAKFPSYIRLLDGDAVGVPAAEMGRKLFRRYKDPSGAGRKALGRAKELSCGGYRDLLLHPNKLDRKTSA